MNKFICQITDTHLKVLKCSIDKKFKKEFSAVVLEPIAADINDIQLAEKIKQAFKKMDYNNNPVTLSLPRGKATLRYIKIPAQSPQEIESILSLQASRYLPYPAVELIHGYQLIQTNSDGSSEVIFIIAHKDIIERYLKIFKELRTPKIEILISSCGLTQLYGYLQPQEEGPDMVIDIDSSSVELAVVWHKKSVFSRYFKLLSSPDNWQNELAEEIEKTRSAFVKETAKEAVKKIIFFDTGKTTPELIKNIGERFNLAAGTLDYTKKLNLAPAISNALYGADTSLSSLLGLGIAEAELSLELLPENIKELNRRLYRRRKQIQSIILISGTILMLILATAKTLANKAEYLGLLKARVKEIGGEAGLLEGIEKRMNLLKSRSKEKPTALEVIQELYQVIPGGVSLINLNYEENSSVTLHGQTTELRYILELLSALDKSAALKGFQAKIRYATKKSTQAGEFIDFEIICSRKK